MAYATESGQVCLKDYSTKKTASVSTTMQTSDNAIFDISFADVGPFLVTASASSKCSVVDVETLESIDLGGHTSTVKAARFFHKDSNKLVSGGRDGSVHLWDLRCTTSVNENGDTYHKSVDCIYGAHAKNSLQCTPSRKSRSRSCTPKKKIALPPKQELASVTSVLPLFDSNFIVTSGDIDGRIKIWDTRKLYSVSRGIAPVMCLPYPGDSERTFGFSSLALDPTGTKLLANCLDHHIYMFDMTSPANVPVKSFYSAARYATFYTKCSFSPDGLYVLSGSKNNNAFVWDVNSPRYPFLQIMKENGGEMGPVGWTFNNPSRMMVSDEFSVALFSPEDSWLTGLSSCSVHPYQPQSEPRNELERNFVHNYNYHSADKSASVGSNRREKMCDPIGNFPLLSPVPIDVFKSPLPSFRARKLRNIQSKLVLQQIPSAKPKISFKLPPFESESGDSIEGDQDSAGGLARTPLKELNATTQTHGHSSKNTPKKTPMRNGNLSSHRKRNKRLSLSGGKGLAQPKSSSASKKRKTHSKKNCESYSIRSYFSRVQDNT